ncbi:uncharacterized protein AC631_01965 [Debaryomyces fabryi]|uniref:Uncharacterized protein n=1 Tax=Debaryomyces fabryi TaxID=58627 RepID=A0A0V1Q1B9_9ASCO|nr:uncharacterized protein AC631_01965 [Debaryomyces fabryi]KSA02315.1 hypothetical protein AC631_01965 [Debaryomyces fabryi]CUM47214.1 unnamed protein product [Debaryomyces fabryi]
MEGPTQLKRRGSWFTKGNHNVGIEILSCNNEDIQIPDLDEDIIPLDQSSPVPEADIDTSWIDTKNVHNDIEELTTYVNKASLNNIKKKLSILGLLKPGSAHNKQEEDSSEEQISLDIRMPQTRRVERCKSQGSLGKSITPLKIRDNINHFLKLCPSQENQEISRQDTCGVFEKVKLISKPLNNNKYINLNGVPCSRLGLIDHNQCAAFMFQLSNIRKNAIDYAFYFDWVVWLERKSEENTKEMYMDRIIETKSDWKVSLKVCKRIMQETPCKIHISKVGTTPRRQSENLIDSGTVEFCVPIEYEYPMFKEISIIVMDNSLYNPLDIQCMYSILSYS